MKRNLALHSSRAFLLAMGLPLLLSCGRDAAPSGSSAPGTAAAPEREASSAALASAAPTGAAVASEPAPGAASKSESAVPREAVIAQSVQVSKWPEQLALVGDSAWIGCSGARVVVQVDLLKAGIARKVKTGVFPVSVAALNDVVYSVDYNSGRGVFTIDAQGAVKQVGRVPDHAELMTADEAAVYVLLGKDNSSRGSSVVRIDPSTHAQTRSQELGPNPMGLATGGGKLWVVVHDTLVALDPTSLAILKQVSAGGPSQQAAANQLAAYTVESGAKALIRVDGASYTVSRAPLGELSVLAANAEYVYALGQSGTLRLFDPGTLALRAELSIGRKIDARYMVPRGKQLFVTEREGDAEGHLTILELRP